MVLIFSVKYDYSTACIIHWLNSWGIKVIRMNGDDDVYKFEQLTNDGIYFKNTITKEIINLKNVTACWWRRTGIKKNHLIKASYRDKLILNDFDLTRLVASNNGTNLINDEAEALIEYIVHSIYKTCPINLGKPVFNLNRLIILDMATKYGLKIPSYEIISTGEQLLKSKASIGNVVTKAIANGIYADVQEHRFYTYTELVEEGFYKENLENTFFPSIINGLIEKQFEIRSFYIDGAFYSMAIFSQSDEKTKIDFRKYTNNRNSPYKLPDNIETKLRNIFIELDLNCGSVDLIVDKNGDYIFLEINPVGQFAMTSEPCNYNLEKIVANYLRNGNKTN